jgi:hypothetical protein
VIKPTVGIQNFVARDAVNHEIMLPGLRYSSRTAD